MSSRLIQYYVDNISPEWKEVLDKVGFADFLFLMEKEYKKKSLVPLNPYDLVAPFLLCPFNDLRVVIVGPAIEPSSFNSNGIYMGGLRGGDSMAVKAVYELSLEYNAQIDKFDYTMRPWVRQGVLMINSIPVSSSSQYGVYNEKCREITDKLLIILQEMYSKKPIVFAYVDYDGKCKNLMIPVHRFKQDYFYGSDFFTEIDRSLRFMKQKPIDWMAIKRENVIHDVEKLMLRRRG